MVLFVLSKVTEGKTCRLTFLFSLDEETRKNKSFSIVSFFNQDFGDGYGPESRGVSPLTGGLEV